MDTVKKKIVVFFPNKIFFGAQITLIPFFFYLKNNIINSCVYVITPVRIHPFFTKQKLIDGCFNYQGHPWRFFRKKLRQLDPDIIFNLRPSTLPVNLAARLQCRQVYSFFRWPAVLLGIKTVPETIQYRSNQYLKLLERAGLSRPATALQNFFHKIAAEAEVTIPDKDYIIFMPGGGAGSFKKWQPQKFLQLQQKILSFNKNLTFVVILGDAEKKMRSIFKEAVCYINPAVSSIFKLCSGARLVIANDCGPSHVAHLLDVKRIILFSNYERDFNEQMANWYLPAAGCRIIVSPYQKERGRQLQQIAPERVWQTAREFLN
ncbi:MAG TPA: glycosyltransferase family 9 protein [Spirochaetota bacterium]|nr:glycosyltransferase family 9 protein [Spirochaetota bacterium]